MECIADHKDAFGKWVVDNREVNPFLKLLFPIEIKNSDKDTLILPVSRHGYHGLVLRFSCEHHNEILGYLQEQAYSVAICKNWKGAVNAITGYLK